MKDSARKTTRRAEARRHRHRPRPRPRGTGARRTREAAGKGAPGARSSVCIGAVSAPELSAQAHPQAMGYPTMAPVPVQTAPVATSDADADAGADADAAPVPSTEAR